MDPANVAKEAVGRVMLVHYFLIVHFLAAKTNESDSTAHPL
jgi:hypothetical protein